MRKIACFLLLWSGSVALLAAETWRWVDAGGVVHYSDRPVPGAERVDLGSRVVRPATPPESPGAAPAPQAGGAQREQPPAFVPYTRCVMASPTHDQVFQGVQNIPVVLDVQPGLQGDHRIEVQVNGRVVESWPAGSLNYSLVEVYRGSYSVSVRILDAEGRQVCMGPSQSFHVRQPSIYSPARRGAG